MKRIRLTGGKEVLVDDDDYELLNKYKWNFGGKGYATRADNTDPLKQTTIYLHREIVNIPPGMICDHIDRDPLNCQKINLRIGSLSQNSQNTKVREGRKFKGVSYCKRIRGSPTWRVRIQVNNKLIHIGDYQTETDAAIAYNIAAKFYFKEFANLNIIEGVTECDYSRIVTRLSGKLNVTYLK